MTHRPGKDVIPFRMHRVTPTATTALPVRPAALHEPMINGRTGATLGYQDLLGTLDKMVYVACSSDGIIYPPASAELYWGVDGSGAPKRIASLPIVTETDSVTFAVRGEDIAGTQDPTGYDYTGDGTHAVFVRLVYGGGSNDDSLSATVVVKCSEPGGPDPIGATPENENLPKPTITPSTVPDLDTPVWIVIEGYDVRYIGDRITVEWGGPRNQFFLAVTSTDGALTVQVPPEIIARVGGGRVPVSYYITDIAGNWSKYAPYAEPLVDIDPGMLVAPQLLYADGTSVEGVVDLDKVGSNHLILRVPVRNLVEGDVVNAWWEATLASGEVVAYESVDLAFNDEDDQLYLDARIENAAALEAAGGTVRVWYVRQGDKVLSKRRTYRVGDLPDVGLPPPEVPQAAGGELDPFAHGNYIVVEVPFDDRLMHNGTLVKVVVAGHASGANTYWTDQFNLSSGDIGRTIVFYCPASKLQEVSNGTAYFHYEVTQPTTPVVNQSGRTRSTPVVSHTLTLRIRRAGAEPELPAPNVPDVMDGSLDPDLPSTRVAIPKSPSLTPGTTVTLHWSGKFRIQLPERCRRQAQSSFESMHLILMAIVIAK
ncbi:hypothetical protein [Luteibacter aegosomatissinici]|uniref:hypothetical protein n=1 Tax=Luteibacter aegosomatissinici TaxID=2911539 RepID=UPI001FF9A1D3|nr:hypothetical protein [Luteibacter aegosomatissinici]UPG96433.1 hypothetical protein L2Y97_10070 [Luteibacter aegosomatissinici]